MTTTGAPRTGTGSDAGLAAGTTGWGAGAAGPGRNPGLDSLRGLAVVAVVAYHLGWLSGGFLGVDLFFVLSGFLITSLLLREHGAAGRIDLGSFWLRRARRLVPAVVVVVPTVLVTAVVLGWPATARRAMAVDGVSALTWWANWRHLGGGGYWSPEPRLFLHSWSLSVEEQFYLAWPLVLVGAVVVARRLGVAVPRAVGVVATATAVASYAWAHVLAHRLAAPDLSRVYLGTDTRVGTPLVGCLLACLVARRAEVVARHRVLARLASVGAGVALAALMVEVSVVDAALYRSGLLPLAALLGAVLVVGATTLPATDPVTRHLGLRSYAIYLWSWPVQKLVEWRWPGASRAEVTVAVVVAVLALAEASHHLVEAPVRFGRGWARPVRRLVPAGVAVAVVVVVALALSVGTAEPLPDYALASDDELVAGVLDGPPDPAGPDRDGLRVMLVGDSVPYALGESLDPDDLGEGIAVVDNRALPQCGILHWGAPDILRLAGTGVRGDLTDPTVYAEYYQEQRDNPVCAAQLDGERAGLAAGPDVVVLMPGAREWGFAFVDGAEVPPLGDEMAGLVGQSILLRARMADEAGARTVVVQWACPGPAWPGPPDGPAYVRWLNGVIDATVQRGRAEGLDMAVVPPDDRICQGGDPAAAPTAGVEEARPDGIHVDTREGAAYVWAWLGPAIVGSGT